MMSLNTVVRGALGRHLDRHPSTIHQWQDLENDLGVTPLGLVLVTVEVEEVEDVILPIEELATVSTVGDLLALLSRSVDHEKSASHHERSA
jgi:acyl carrier protein